MTAEQLAYWLQGFAELHPEPPTAAQWQAIRAHIALVFHKVTPPLVTEHGLLPRRSYPLDEVRDILRPRRGNPAREDDVAARRSVSRDRIIC